MLAMSGIITSGVLWIVWILGILESGSAVIGFILSSNVSSFGSRLPNGSNSSLPTPKVDSGI